jgi:hypothetical protein
MVGLGYYTWVKTNRLGIFPSSFSTNAFLIFKDGTSCLSHYGDAI